MMNKSAIVGVVTGVGVGVGVGVGAGEDWQANPDMRRIAKRNIIKRTFTPFTV